MTRLLILLFSLLVPSLQAQTTKAEMDELKRRMDILASELERVKLGEVAVKADQQMYGLSPAASKIYRVNQGLSVGGYGEIIYKNPSSKRENGTLATTDDSTDVLRTILYLGYRLDEKFLINIELEFEHAGANDGSGFAGAEFAYVDYLNHPSLNFRAGLLLIPMGFINELHEPTIFLGVLRPDVESKIIPTTWRENGFGAWGDIGKFTYRTYLVNGFRGDNFTAAGVRGGRQKGAEAKAKDLAWVGRLDFKPNDGSLIGASAYLGGSDHDVEGNGVKASATTQIYDVHLEWKKNAIQSRFLAALAKNNGVESLNAVKATPLTGNQTIGEELRGYYVEVGYDFWQGVKGQALIPFVRYSSYNTQHKVPVGFSKNPANEVTKTILGVSVLPHPNVVVKADYEIEKNEAQTGTDAFNLGLGFNF
jgi:hypothetical protein